MSRSEEDKKIMAKSAKEHKKARQMFPTPKCGKKHIIKEGYYKDASKRRSYKRASGKSVKGSWVAPKCIQSRTGKSEKGQQLFVLRKDTLGQFGYSTKDNETKRHASLKRASKSKKVGALSAYRKLIAVGTVNKNTNPRVSRIVKEDAEWLKGTTEYANRKK